MKPQAESQSQKYQPVNASPVKSFFVSMLTRDISLADAVLDLLDNCVDGILRSRRHAEAPFQGYRAEITFDSSSFMIHDNCGGIPWSLSSYAFRLGAPRDRPNTDLPMVGVYGIGMKRAVFKLGKQCLITTQSASDSYEVEIDSAWIEDEENWNIPVRSSSKPMTQDGTTIVVGQLYEGISRTLGDGKESFQAELARRVAEQYAFIIAKGFEVKINKASVAPRPTRLVFTPIKARGSKKDAIGPFIYRATIDEVDVFLAIGLTQALPTAEEIVEEDAGSQGRYRTLEAGWTIVCNDRAVVYCDRTELTGWGEDDIPRYHTQFIAISGIVEFRSKDPRRLPTNTQKRGIDAASPIYLKVKNKMREGLKLFTTFTYWWKGREPEVRALVDKQAALTFLEVKKRAQQLPMHTLSRRSPGGEQFKPNLPRPKEQEASQKRISFLRPLDQVRAVGQYLLHDSDANPSRVGEECFNQMLLEAEK